MRKNTWIGIILAFLVATAAVALNLQGGRATDHAESVVYINEGTLHSANPAGHSNPYSQSPSAAKNRDDIPADSLFDISSTTILFGRQQSNGWPSAWMLDRETGTIRELFAAVSMARLSPDGSRVAVTTGGNEVHLVTREGVDLGRVGVHGGSAVFSPDGHYLAYMKLSDRASDLELGDPRRFAGIALYNIDTGREKLVLPATHNEYGVSYWSPDGHRIFYVAEHEAAPNNWSAAMYSIRSDGSDKRLEVDPLKSSAPPFNSRTVWFPDLRIAISESNGIWGYLLDDESRILKSVRLSGGENLQLLKAEGSFAFEKSANPATWTVVNAEKLQLALESSDATTQQNLLK